MINERRRAEAVGLGEEKLQVFAESPAVLRPGQLVDRGQLGQLRVLAGELLVNGQDAPGDLQADGQLIRVGRFGQKVVGAGAQPVQPVLPPIAGGQQDDVGVAVAARRPGSAGTVRGRRGGASSSRRSRAMRRHCCTICHACSPSGATVASWPILSSVRRRYSAAGGWSSAIRIFISRSRRPRVFECGPHSLPGVAEPCGRRRRGLQVAPVRPAFSSLSADIGQVARPRSSG